jgi:phosphate transport system protein
MYAYGKVSPMPREHYDEQLRQLQEHLLRLGGQVEAAVGAAIASFQHHDIEAARRVIAEDDIIDRAQYALEDRALNLIARQAPLAADLRLISAVISVAGELERVGDYAEGIAKLTVRGAMDVPLEPPPQVAHMARLSQQMLRDALDAFVRRDVEAARRLGVADDEVDELTTVVQDHLLDRLRQPAHVEPALRLFFVTHNLERVADRATNIAERIVFLVTGEIKDLNQ